jgi:hypothetical protein
MPQRNWLLTGVSSGFGRIMTGQLLAGCDRIAGTVRNLSVMDDLMAKDGERLWLPSSTCPRLRNALHQTQPGDAQRAVSGTS